MIQALINIFRIPDLRNRVLFTLSMLVIYRIGFFIPLVGVDQTALAEVAEKASEDAGGFGRFLEYASIFTGGDFGRSTVFGLGIMPYITAAIIFQLLQTAVPRLQELKKEGATGQQKITEWTRYATVGLCIVQGIMWLKYMEGRGIVQPAFSVGPNKLMFMFAGVTSLAAGSLFLMWLGEQIDKYGIGNG
ncbi:MAG: preprotein translocase subunit SecY, partial [Planctomycetota bacterium]